MTPLRILRFATFLQHISPAIFPWKAIKKSLTFSNMIKISTAFILQSRANLKDFQERFSKCTTWRRHKLLSRSEEVRDWSKVYFVHNFCLFIEKSKLQWVDNLSPKSIWCEYCQYFFNIITLYEHSLPVSLYNPSKCERMCWYKNKLYFEPCSVTFAWSQNR